MAANITAGTVTAGDGISCIFYSVSPGTILVAILGLFVPLIVLVWGLRGGFAMVAKLVMSFFRLLTGRA